uniref:Uncharacterized protein n=1 Tax=Arundo donax TaxID=35708 RepID=A0A0A9EK98_ARUDO
MALVASVFVLLADDLCSNGLYISCH